MRVLLILLTLSIFSINSNFCGIQAPQKILASGDCILKKTYKLFVMPTLFLLIVGTLQIPVHPALAKGNFDAVLSLQSSAPGPFPYSADGTLFGYVDLSGEFVIEPQFQFAGEFNDGLAVVSLEQKYGYIDPDGQIVIEPQFDYADVFSEDLAAVTVEGKVGFIDKTGQIVIEPQFDYTDAFHEGLASVSLDGKTGYIDQTGKIVIAPQFEFANAFSEGLASVHMSGKAAYIDQTGKIVIEPQYDWGGNFSEGLASVTIGDKSGFINKTGQMVIEPQYEVALDFSEGLAPVSVDGQYGYIDPTGTLVIEPQFTYADRFSEGLAWVNVAGLYGYVDPKGNVVIEPQFTSASPFKDGVANIISGDQWGYIDQTGNLLLQLPLPPSSVGSTSLISFLPGVPVETKDGSCFTHSLITPIASAFRCSTDTTDGNGANLFDPCLIAADGQTLVCGADPSLGEPGFQLNLTEPLPEPEVIPVATPKTSGEVLTPEMLANAAYTVDMWTDNDTLQLVDGELPPEDEAAAAGLQAHFLPSFTAFGDLNADGVEDAAALLAVNGGGTGTFIYLAAMIDDNGQPKNISSVLLGDRVEIKSVSVDAGQIVINLVTQGPSDPMCCPTEEVTWRYELQDMELISSDANAWLLQLANGATCNFATGATAVIDNKRINYLCSDQSSLLGNLQPGLVWTAEAVADADITSTGTGFVVSQTKTIPISLIWQPVDPAEVVQEIGLGPDEVEFDPSGVVEAMQKQITPAVPYDPNMPPAFNGEPAHLQINFGDEALADGFNSSQPRLLIYPVAAYQAIYQAAGLDGIDQRISTLQSLLKDRPAAVQDEIPVLPDLGASQDLKAQIKYLDFNGGSGIRFIAHYAQDAGPVISGSIFYTFQGLTDDGQYYVAFFQPLITDALPATYDETAAAKDYDAFAQNFEAYLRETTQTLDGLNPGDFSPDLSKLDAMLETLKLGP